MADTTESSISITAPAARVMEVIADLEDKFHLHIPDEALREVDTIRDVCAAVEARLQNDGRLEG